MPSSEIASRSETENKSAFIPSTNLRQSSDEEYDRQIKLEDGDAKGSSASDLGSTLSSAEEKKLLRRIDWHLLPLMAAMYVIKTIDAQNVSRPYDRLGFREHIWTNSLCSRFQMLVPWIKTRRTISCQSLV